MTRPSPPDFIYRDGPEGGTPITAAKKNAEIAFMKGADVDLDNVEDRLDAVEARLGGSGGASDDQDLAVTVAELANITPAEGKRVYVRGPNKPVWGDGSSWRDAVGTLLSGSGGGGGGDPTPGTTGAPQNFRAVVNPNNSISLSWDPVSGATAYTVRETRSPGGVSGMPITTTSSTRTPSSMGDYEYWVTCTNGGVESAASNKVALVLPYGSTSTGGSGNTSGTPASILNFGGSGGFWDCGIGFKDGHKNISYAELIGGYQNFPYLTPVENDTAVQFQVFANGATTSDRTEYPRSELREYKSDGVTKAAWNAASGTHVLSGSTSVQRFMPNKKEVCLAQIHDGSDDRLQIRCEDTTWVLKINGEDEATLLTGYSLGAYVSWEIKLVAGKLTIRINGSQKYSGTPGYTGTQFYFKVGHYMQQNTSNGNAATDYGRSYLKNLVLSHS